MKDTADNPLILIDGSSYLYRAFNAYPQNMTNGEIQTNAIYGVINMLHSTMRQFLSPNIAVIFDAKGKTFRHEMYSEYKATRKSMPSELSEQIPILFEVIKALGLPLISIEGVEADDVIGSLAHQASKQGMSVVISTGDKDMAQLVNDKISLINTMNNTMLDTDGVIEKFGIKPDLIIDYLALMGDKSDNIPGVAGIGEKIAIALLQQIGGLDALYANLDAVANLELRGAKGIAKKLSNNKENAKLSYQLATIKLDVKINHKIDTLVKNEPNIQELKRLYTKLVFKPWLKNLQNDVQKLPDESIDNKVTKDHYETILDEDSLQKWITKLQTTELFAFDTETDGLNYMQANLVGLSFAIYKNDQYQAAYLPLRHDYLGAPEQLNFELTLEQLKPLLENPLLKKVGQNLKFDISIMARYNISIQGVAHDTMLASYVHNSTGGKHDMDSLALRFLQHTCISFEHIAGKGKNQLTFNQIQLEQAVNYAAEDADVTLRLHHTLNKELEQEASLNKLYQEIEIPLIPVLSRMERCGVLIDSAKLNLQSQEISQRLLELEKQAYDLVGQEFNINSPKQLQAIFFDNLGLPVINKTPSGAPSTNEEALQELALDYPLPKLILEYRGLAKLKSTYTDKLPTMIDPITKRVHTSYHQAITATGRLSSADPNLQNIPIRNESGRRIRQAFIAPTGYKMLALDYSQIELRIMAHLAQDQTLINAFLNGDDIHAITAAEILSIDVNTVSSEERRRAKAINFGLIYGMSAFGLAKQLGISRNEAQEYIDIYFQRYPAVLKYMEATRKQALEQGYVETIFGRRLYLPEINSSNMQRRRAAERTAINAPMQGTAADIIKIAMLKVDHLINNYYKDKVKLLMQVHDELVLEVQEDILPRASLEIKQLMELAAQISVPLVVELGIGDNWEQAH